MRYKNLILLLIVVILIAVPFFLKGSAEYNGADVQAGQAISQVAPNYQPWFKPLWEPPSGEVETFMFAFQSAIGAGFIGYFLGLSKGKRMAATDKKIV